MASPDSASNSDTDADEPDHQHGAELGLEIARGNQDRLQELEARIDAIESTAQSAEARRPELSQFAGTTSPGLGWGGFRGGYLFDPCPEELHGWRLFAGLVSSHASSPAAVAELERVVVSRGKMLADLGLYHIIDDRLRVSTSYKRDEKVVLFAAFNELSGETNFCTVGIMFGSEGKPLGVTYCNGRRPAKSRRIFGLVTKNYWLSDTTTAQIRAYNDSNEVKYKWVLRR